MIFLNQFAKNHISKLKVLKLKGDHESTCIPLRILESFQSLEKLNLNESVSFKEIFSCGENEKHEVTTPTQIKVLKISSFYELKHMWDSNLDLVFQNLETLKIEDCDKLLNVVPSSKSFQNLTILEVFGCNGLENLLTTSTVKSLKLLREMRIQGCELMVVVAKKEDVSKDEIDEIVFNELKLLSLEDLESLTSFSFGNYSLKFPLLDELIVRGCPKMETFFEGNLTAPRLEKVKRYERSDNDEGSDTDEGFDTDEVSNNDEGFDTNEVSDNDEGFWKDDLNTTIQQLHKKEKNVQSSEKDLGEPSTGFDTDEVFDNDEGFDTNEESDNDEGFDTNDVSNNDEGFWKDDLNTAIQQLHKKEKNVQSSEKDSGEPSTQPPV